MTLNQELFEISRAFVGVREIPGIVQNPFLVRTIKWALPWVTGNNIESDYAWCGMWQGYLLKSAGRKDLIPKHFYRARSWLNIGESVEIADAQKGDWVILWRGSPHGWKGHVMQFERFELDNVIGLGGNQGNAVSFAPYPQSRILGIRRINENTLRAKSLRTTSFIDWVLLKSLKL